MKDRYLQVTFRSGKPPAAYLYLPRAVRAKPARTKEAGRGLVIHFAKDGSPIGLEILAPRRVTALGLRQLASAELARLRAIR